MNLVNGLYGDNLKKIQEINENYEIYEGKQEWTTHADLDYEPTKKITNYIKKLVDTKARFMFGKEPFLDVRATKPDEKGSTTYQDQAQEKEDLLNVILRNNKFHSKLLKGMKDCLIGGKVAIKLWANKDKGLKLIFSPAQEFFPTYNIDDIDELEKVMFLYGITTDGLLKEQRFKKQTWELVNGKCILNEGIFDGAGKLIEPIEVDYDTELDFIPVVIIQNGGLTGETEGASDVETLWSNQNAYNRLTSDDMDALKFNMFPQRVATDASEKTLKDMSIAPGALVDLQTDEVQSNYGLQAKLEVVESNFAYDSKYTDTVNRVKNDMYDLLDVPNVSLEQLRGLMASGKSMKALYWGLINVCEEASCEWIPALKQMVHFIFKMVETYNLYGSKEIVRVETDLEVIRTYPIAEDTLDEKKMDLEEVRSESRSKKSYINKWEISEDVDSELEQIQLEKSMFDIDNYTKDLISDVGEEGSEEDEE